MLLAAVLAVTTTTVVDGAQTSERPPWKRPRPNRQPPATTVRTEPPTAAEDNAAAGGAQQSNNNANRPPWKKRKNNNNNNDDNSNNVDERQQDSKQVNTGNLPGWLRPIKDPEPSDPSEEPASSAPTPAADDETPPADDEPVEDEPVEDEQPADDEPAVGPDDTTATNGDGGDDDYKCWNNITAIYYDLESKPSFSQNTYHICPGIYGIGYQYGRGLCCENGHYPIVARSFTHFKCGPDGSSKNGCVFVAGTSHVLINDVIFDEEITGCTIEGFTFKGPRRTTSFAAAAGDITFKDCIFEDQANEAPILAIHDNGIRLLKEKHEVLKHPEIEPLGFAMSQEMLDLHEKHANLRRLEEATSSKEVEGRGHLRRHLQDQEADLMTLIFDECIFRNNSQAPPVDDIPTYGIVVGRSPDNIFEFHDCLFIDNHYNGVSTN